MFARETALAGNPEPGSSAKIISNTESSASPDYLPTRARHIARVVFTFALLLGLVGMLGWLLGISSFQTLAPDLASMKFNTALGIILLALAGFSLLQPQRKSVSHRVMRAGYDLVFLLALLTIGQSFSGINLGIDELLFSDPITPVDQFPGRMSVATSTSLLLLALAGWCQLRGLVKPGQFVAIAVMVISAVAVLAYLYDTNVIYSMPVYSSMAVHTSLATLLLAGGQLLASGAQGYLQLAYQPGTAGLVIRKLLPYVLILPFLFSGFFITAESAWGIDVHFGLFLMAVLVTVVLSLAVLRIAQLLQELELAREEARQQEEQTIERLAQMKRIESMGLVAGGIAHDFNNLLMPIKWSAELALSQLEHGDRDHKHFQSIKTSADKATALARKMMELGKANQVKFELLNINTVIMDFADILKGLGKGGVQFQFELEDDICEIVADKGQVEQILLNLTSNACRAMQYKGELRIQTESITIDPDQLEQLPSKFRPEQYACLTVQDTGSGMSAEVKANALKPFYTTRKSADGHGLGLSTVNDIVLHHLGYIAIDSKEGEGCTMQIYLPTRILASVDSLTTTSTATKTDQDKTLLQKVNEGKESA